MESGLLSKHCTGQAESRAVSTIAGQGTVVVLKSPRQWPMKCSGEEKEDSHLLSSGLQCEPQL